MDQEETRRKTIDPCIQSTPDELGPLSEAEQRAGLATLAQLKELREDMLRRRQGELFPNAAEDLRKLRAERSRQLRGENNDEN